MLRVYSWLHSGVIPQGLGGLYGVLGNEPWLMCARPYLLYCLSGPSYEIVNSLTKLFYFFQFENKKICWWFSLRIEEFAYVILKLVFLPWGVCGGGPPTGNLVMFRGYPWLCDQESLLSAVVFEGLYGMLWIEPRSSACKICTVVLPTYCTVASASALLYLKYLQI